MFDNNSTVHLLPGVPHNESDPNSSPAPLRCTIVHIAVDVQVEWDPRKAEANWRKHGVRFADAVGVLEDPLALTVQDTSTDEERWATVGTDGLGRVLVVIYTWRNKAVRIISARRAMSRERRQYQREKL